MTTPLLSHPPGVDQAHLSLRWGAIAAGAVVALATLVALVSLGLGLGITAWRSEDGAALGTLKLFSGVWGAAAPLLALGAGGWVAGRSAGVGRATSGGLHGLVMWAVAALALVWGVVSSTASVASSIVGGVASTSQMIVGGAADAARGALATVGDVGGAAAEAGRRGVSAAGEAIKSMNVDLDAAMKPINDRLAAQGRPRVDLGEVRGATEALVRRAAAEGRLDRELFVRTIGERTSLSREDTAALADAVEAQLRELAGRGQELVDTARQRAESLAERVRQEAGPARARIEEIGKPWVEQATTAARAGAERLADAIRAAFLGLFVALLLGLGAAVGGGTLGAITAPRGR